MINFRNFLPKRVGKNIYNRHCIDSQDSHAQGYYATSKQIKKELRILPDTLIIIKFIWDDNVKFCFADERLIL
jgi:hypothetical protein